MKAAKTETITVRIEPAVKAGLKTMAEKERRSLANMIEVMIRDYCGRNGIGIDDPVTISGKSQTK
ncbi:MAG: CopG family transcriptional regulator [Halofilum sp. (in: g-proteobacteria)]|nr:CopG family transcriptional regulator [Halofilum sp. (in: g-proteobacteria)]